MTLLKNNDLFAASSTIIHSFILSHPKSCESSVAMLYDESEMIHDLNSEASLDEDKMPAPTSDEVERWTEELRAIKEQKASLAEREALLEQVLETMPAIEKLRGNAPLVPDKAEPAHESASIIEEGPKLVNAIPMVLLRYRTPMTPAQIKKHLKDVGFTRGYGETYFYTAVKRAVEKRTIIKKRDGRYQAAEPLTSAVNGNAS